MFTTISIHNFRGLRDFRIEPLGRVNLIAGANGVGKTSLLEAVILLANEAQVGLAVAVNGLRGVAGPSSDPRDIREVAWPSLFHGLSADTPISIEGAGDDGKRAVELKMIRQSEARVPVSALFGQTGALKPGSSDGPSGTAATVEDTVSSTPATPLGTTPDTLEMLYTGPSGDTRSAQMVIDEQGVRIQPPQPLPSTPTFIITPRTNDTGAEASRLFGKLEVVQRSYDVVKVLQIIEPRLTRISAIQGFGGAMLYGDIGLERMLPLGLLGDGLGRLVSFALAIGNTSHGVVLIDEIETGLHYSVLPKVWAAICEAARVFDVQVFATTHSWECILAAHQSLGGNGHRDFRYHRLDRADGDVRAVSYTDETLATSIELGLEVR